VLIGEPARTQADLRFSLLGMPVRVHPFFWLIGVLLGPLDVPLTEILARLAAFFLAILVHELGHALVIRAYGFHPWITLYGLGGLASYDPSQGRYGRGGGALGQILISAAGPGAGFLLGLVTFAAVLLATGEPIGVELGGRFGISITYVPITSIALLSFVWYLLFISVVWGIVNLLPVYPLDGGQIARELFLKLNPRDGIRRSLLLSIYTAVIIAVLVLVRSLQQTQGKFSLAILWVPALFGYLAYFNYQTLQAYTGRERW
jgi:Zn-dependent protease